MRKVGAVVVFVVCVCAHSVLCAAVFDRLFADREEQRNNFCETIVIPVVGPVDLYRVFFSPQWFFGSDYALTEAMFF